MIEQDLAVLARLRDAALAVAEAVAAHVEAGVQARAQAQAAAQAPDPASLDAPAPSRSADAPSPVPAAPPLFTGDPILAMARAARAVRMTVALRLRMIDDLERLDELQGRRGASHGVALRAERKGQIARLLTRIIHDETVGAADLAPVDGDAESDAASEGEFGEAEGLERAETEERAYRLLIDAASERLQDRDRFGDVLDRPISAFVDHVCRDLGLSPDWRRLAEEAWAHEEIASGRVGAPLARLSSPARGGEGPAQPVERAPPRRSAPSVTARTRRATFPARGEGEQTAASSVVAPIPPPLPMAVPTPVPAHLQAEPPAPQPEPGLPGESPPLRSGHRRRGAAWG